MTDIEFALELLDPLLFGLWISVLQYGLATKDWQLYLVDRFLLLELSINLVNLVEIIVHLGVAAGGWLRAPHLVEDLRSLGVLVLV